ncbi:diguanylate cyclase [Alginatibacterium sediminis]|uniref:Diguanylate cyclase n=1 Tax=Alginatibacterium sediminis TaxID=2164068 RepID=A0A420EAN8_9ALTE|nr:diguanylate cyclase [Alginatibacterium sediminis]RKF17758.1 diguanylate cyclase [Alginatibacterium sediminis]
MSILDKHEQLIEESLSKSWDVMVSDPAIARTIIQSLLREDTLSDIRKGECYMHLGWCDLYSGQAQQASQHFLNCIELEFDIKEVSILIKAYNGLGSSYTEQGLFKAAIVAFNQALAYCQSEAQRKQSIPTHLNVLTIYVEIEDLVAAKQTVCEIERLISAFGTSPENTCIEQILKGDICLLESELERAQSFYCEGLAYAEQSESQFATFDAKLGMCRVARLQGNTQIARQILDQLQTDFDLRSAGNSFYYLSIEQALLLCGDKDVDGAIKLLEKTIAQEQGSLKLLPVIKAQEKLSDFYAMQGDYESAFSSLHLVFKSKEQIAGSEAQQQLILYQANENFQRLQQEAKSERKMRLELEELHQRLTLIEKIGRDLSSSLDLSEIVRHFYRSMKHELGVDAVAIGTFNELENSLEFDFAIEFDRYMEPFQIAIDDPMSLNAECFLTQGMLVADAKTFSKAETIGNTEKQMLSGIYIPLNIAQDKIGVLTLQSTVDGIFQDSAVINVLKSVSDYLCIAVRNGLSHAQLKQMKDKLLVEKDQIEIAKSEVEYQALHDGLTSLPNRRMLIDCVKARIFEARLRNENFYLLYLDLNEFKPVNDTYGHSVGDQLLIAFSQRVRNFLRSADLLARIGGDEFVVLVTGQSTDRGISELLARLNHEIEQPFLIDEINLSISASIGVSTYPQDGHSFDRLLHAADIQMYRTKALQG